MTISKKQRGIFSQLQSRLNRRLKRRLRYEHLEARYLLAGVDFDGDGVEDAIEDAGPNSGDGNNDAILDSEQGRVASLPNAVTGNYATLVTNVGTLAGVAAVDNPSPTNAPAGTTFASGFFEFEVQGVSTGGPANVQIISTDSVTFDSFWNYGPTSITATNSWYEYTAGFDGRGGASFDGNSVTLTLIDGATGDDDLAANGVISRLGGPGVTGASAGSGERAVLSDSIPATVAGNVAVDGIIAGTYSSEANFAAELIAPTLYDFEQPQFPAASAIIGVVDDIDFLGRIGFAAAPLPPSGSQFMRGTGPTAPYDEQGIIDFSQVASLPNAVGFFTGFGGISAPAPFTRVQIVSSTNALLREEFIPYTGGGGTYFGFISDGSAIQTIRLQGFEADLVTPADGEQFGIDDLTIGLANQGPTTSSIGTPGLLSAARNATGGTTGTRRVHVEWDVTALAQTSIEQAEVKLHTNQGTTDVLDTFFFAATQDGNGTLEATDFETFAQQIDGVAMEVTGVPGQTGTFTFDVTAQLQSAINAGFDYFIVQGRVDEAPVNGPFERGLQFSSTLGSNPVSEHPQLNVTYQEPTDPADIDGVSDAVETGAPNQGDGNKDGELDSQQNNVASLTNAATGEYVTVAAVDGLQLSSVSVSQPAPPAGVELPIGAVSYTLSGLAYGAATVVEIYPESPLPAGTSYYKFGPEPGNTTPHWYEFLFDNTNTTGAEFETNGSGEVTKITLHLVDGARGDSDLAENGTIIDPGGPSVTNIAPSLTVANATSTTGIGSTATNTGTFADALGQVVKIDSSIGKVSKVEGNSGDWSWKFGPAAGSGDNQLVTITATDNFGAQSTVQFDLVVNDSLPDVQTIVPNTPLTVAEGFNVTVTGTYNPSAGAPSLSGVAFWSDGVELPVTLDGAGNFSTSRVLDDTGTDADGGIGTVTVTVTIIDASLGSDSITSAPIGVTNTPPTIELTGADDANEGSPYTLTLGTVNDPGDTVTSYSIAWGDGTVDNFSGLADNAVRTHTYADDLASAEIVVSLNDEDGTHTGGSKTITVNNVAPTIELSGVGVVSVGEVYQLTLGSVADPGADTVTGYSVDWNDGTVQNFTGRPDGETLTHTYSAPQSATISVSLVDEDGTFANLETKTVAVTDVPTVTADTAEVTVNEGVTAGNSGTFDDTDSNVVISTNVGNISQNPIPGSSGTWSWSLGTTDGPDETQTVTITATDGFGASSSTSFELIVNNLPPTANAGADQTVDEGDTVNLDGSFSDPGSNDTQTFLWEVSADNGQVIADGTGEDFSFVPADNGIYTLTYTVTDNDGDSGSDTVVITVNNAAPVITGISSSATFANKADPLDDVTLSGTFTDAGGLDTHTATADWGDGFVEAITVTGGTFTGTHSYTGGGIFTITVTLTDGTDERIATTTAVVTGVRLLANGELQIIGTDVKDKVKIEIKSDGGADFVQVDAELGGSDGSFDDKVLFPINDVTSILAHLCGGDDELEIDKKVEIDAVVFGDGGKDKIKGGGGNDQLFGGEDEDEIDGRGGDDQIFGGDGPDKLRGGTDGGDDQLFGGEGDDELKGDDGNDILVGDAGDDKLEGGDDLDLLIGGIGADDLNGKKGGDVLIGGTTTDDSNPSALAAVLDAWTGAANYAAGVAAVDAALTVQDDEHTDELKGDDGQDLFYEGIGDDLDDVAGDESVLPEEAEGESILATALSLAIEALSIAETQATTATLTRIAADLSLPLTVTLASGDPSELSVPESVTIPAGSSSITIDLSGVNDGSIDGSQVAAVIARAQDAVTAVASLLIDEGSFPYQNAINSLDVDGDGVVAPKDALQVINELLRSGARALADGESLGMLDVTGDNQLSALDVLRIFNFLNGATTPAAVGEGASVAGPSSSTVESTRGEDSDVPGRYAAIVVTTDLTGTTVESHSDVDSLSADDPELATEPDNRHQTPSTTAESSSSRATQVDESDSDELGAGLDELAEDLAAGQQLTAHDLFFGRLS